MDTLTRTSAVAAARPALAWLLCLGLAACGGGREETGGASSTATARVGTEGVVFEQASSAPPAWLNAKSLEDAEVQAKATSAESAPLEKLAAGQIAAWDDYASGNVARKSAAVRIPVYRFYNRTTGAHFYTTNETEKANILATMPNFNYDGPAYEAASETAPGLSPVYRFYNTQNGVHFYTISEAEKTTILASYPQFVLEGPAYYASQVSGQGLTPLYRFYVPSKGYHFYTASSAERDTIQSTLSGTYSYEGIGYYVPSSSWNADKLPHTGIGTNQCYGRNIVTGTDFFGTCSLIAIFSSLYSQQDSARTTHNPMSYGSVFRRVGLFFITEPKTNCVYDQVTGLYWEGKTDDGGVRDKDNLYSNQGGGAATDASGYVAAVNGSSLCGFTDWRMPTALELMTLNHYGRTDAAPYVDPTWFPNTLSTPYYWTGEATSGGGYWTVTHGTGRYEGVMTGDSLRAVRLVRGSMGSVAGGRYTYSTIAYGTDGTNNVVNDKLTGLQWRRCLEGQTWSGYLCSGTPTTYTHRAALVYSNASGLPASGWRLPNVKEGSSLFNKAATAAPFINSSAFPGAASNNLWTTTADAVDGLNNAYIISMTSGWMDISGRSNTHSIRLVR
ncbi:DUF1566 domain-containing protein [Hydrogenophaga sp. RWCD_12]|uniref:DUF1566 domain-containing protein n=1 Tax=Hydrogenophaga sp. RWCD_12 TaxID=3391190 RepID=UPI003984B1A7